MPDSLNAQQQQEVARIAELETRKYFDYYLDNVWPEQQKALQQYADNRIQNHDDDRKAHGGVEMRLSRLLWMGVGLTMAGGAGGAGLTRLLIGLV